jgi:phosphate transport system permease protein
MIRKLITTLFISPMIIIFILMIGFIVINGANDLNWQYFISEPSHSGRTGGVAPILLSTSYLLALTLLIATPFSFATALALTFYIPRKGLLKVCGETSLSLLSGLPSIIFGIFGAAFFGRKLGLGYSILTGSLTLSCMIFPFYTKILYENFKSIPNDYFLAGSALNLSHWQITKNIISPLNTYGIFAGIIFSMSKSLGETAALVFTSGYVDKYPHSIFESGRSLSVHIYDLAMNVSGADEAAMRASLVFLIFSFALNAIFNFSFNYSKKRIGYVKN